MFSRLLIACWRRLCAVFIQLPCSVCKALIRHGGGWGRGGCPNGPANTSEVVITPEYHRSAPVCNLGYGSDVGSLCVSLFSFMIQIQRWRWRETLAKGTHSPYQNPAAGTCLSSLLPPFLPVAPLGCSRAVRLGHSRVAPSNWNGPAIAASHLRELGSCVLMLRWKGNCPGRLPES